MPKKTFSDGSTYGAKELAATVALAAVMTGAFFGAKAVAKKTYIKVRFQFGYGL